MLKMPVCITHNTLDGDPAARIYVSTRIFYGVLCITRRHQYQSLAWPELQCPIPLFPEPAPLGQQVEIPEISSARLGAPSSGLNVQLYHAYSSPGINRA